MGTGGTTNSGGSAGASAGGSAGDSAAPPCIGSAAEGAFVGDSYITGVASPALQTALGSLDATVNNFRNYAVAGTALATGGITGLIPPQLTNALMQTTKLVIMDGGSNDILICDEAQFPACTTKCTTSGSSTQSVCKTMVQKATDAAKTMMTQEATAGVHDVILFFPPHIPDTGPGGDGFDEIFDYAESMERDLCNSASSFTSGKLFCHFVDLVEPFKAAGGDKATVNFAADGIHPSQTGQNIAAKAIFNTMKASCVGMTSGDATKNSCTCR